MSDKLRLAAAIEALVPGGPGISLDIAFIRVCSCGMSQVTLRAPLEAEIERLRAAALALLNWYDGPPFVYEESDMETRLNALRAALEEPTDD